MRIARFYIDKPLVADTEIELDQATAHYMNNVLRLKAGTPIVMFNGNGNDYPSEVLEISKKRTTILVNSQLCLNNESPINIHLGQGISKGDRMDFVLQKSVELGVSEITPLLTERCVVKLSKERWQKKQDQWQKIIISACEQSNRNVVPNLNPIVSLAEWSRQQSDSKKVLLSPTSTQYLTHMNKPSTGVRLLIGPEGGLTDQEIYTCEQTGFFSANIGPRILRTETAALASIAILQSLFGDM